jgi:menaquinone-9 beta-reductase
MVESQPCADVFVVGGGPAGLAAAIAARQKGFHVVVADGAAPPIEKPCGEGMMPETLAVLQALGVEISPAEGHRFSGISLAQQGARVSAYFPRGLGIGLRRRLLHERLVARAEQCGVRLLWRAPVSGIDADGVQLPFGKIHASWIVGADGLGSRVRRWSGLERSGRRRQRHASRRHYRVRPWSDQVEIHWGARAQVYVTPIGAEELCVVVMSERMEDASFASAFQELPELRDRLVGAELSSRERGAVTSMRSLNHVARSNVALVGDASGSVDAITGEGLRLAFGQAFALGDAMLAGDLGRYEQAHRQLAKRPMLMGGLMLSLGRNPRVRKRVVAALQSKPSLFARLLAAHVGGTYRAGASRLELGSAAGCWLPEEAKGGL